MRDFSMKFDLNYRVVLLDVSNREESEKRSEEEKRREQKKRERERERESMKQTKE